VQAAFALSNFNGTILFIPQQYLAEQGKPFEVTGSFSR
jgi:hypothetical protein